MIHEDLQTRIISYIVSTLIINLIIKYSLKLNEIYKINLITCQSGFEESIEDGFTLDFKYLSFPFPWSVMIRTGTGKRSSKIN